MPHVSAVLVIHKTAIRPETPPATGAIRGKLFTLPISNIFTLSEPRDRQEAEQHAEVKVYK